MLKKKAISLCMVLSVLFGILSPSMDVFAIDNNQSKGENEAGIYEVITTLSEDKQVANVKVLLQPKENITIYSATLPNGEEKAVQTNSVEFQMSENGTYSLGIQYQSTEDTELKITEISFAISGVEKNSKTNEQASNIKDTNAIKNFNLTSVKRTSTGTGDFDNNDDPGNDSSKTNNIVRSFDSILYDMTYAGEMNTAVSSAEIEFELSLNVSKKYAEFNEEVLSSWMNDITQEDIKTEYVS